MDSIDRWIHRHERPLTWLPLVLVLIYTALMAAPATRRLAYWSLQENRPIELLTVIALLLAGWRIAMLAAARAGLAPAWLRVLWGLLALLLIFAGMEEIAWGQWFLGFETPEAIRDINQQGELTLHNIDGLHGKSEVFRVAFGLAGLAAMALGRLPRWQPLEVPAFLGLAFALIVGLSVLDLVNDYVAMAGLWTPEGDRIVNELSEVVEMVIGWAAFAYVSSQIVRWRPR